LWLDNITRNLPDKGTLKRYIEELSITGLTSNPTVFGLPLAWLGVKADAIELARK
jgi:transaldolase